MKSKACLAAAVAIVLLAFSTLPYFVRAAGPATHGVPVINFERCMVLAVFKGNTWNVAGVYVESVLDEGARRVVRVRRRGYQTAGPNGGGKRATPYGIFVLPRSNKELVVEEDVRTLKNEPPKWNEIARFTALRP